MARMASLKRCPETKRGALLFLSAGDEGAEKHPLGLKPRSYFVLLDAALKGPLFHGGRHR